MSMVNFIRENRDEIDRCIKRVLNSGRVTPMEISLNNDERREWILNDEGLYNWARSEGVPI